MRLGRHDLIETTRGRAGRGHEQSETGVATLEGIEDIIPDRFGFINQERGRAIVLVVDTFDIRARVGGASEQETAGGRPHLA